MRKFGEQYLGTGDILRDYYDRGHMCYRDSRHAFGVRWRGEEEPSSDWPVFAVCLVMAVIAIVVTRL